MKLLAFDCETGGLDPTEVSLLTLYLQTLDSETFEKRSELYLRIKPKEGPYHVTAEALNINKINLVEHDKIAVSYATATQMLKTFLSNESNGGQIKLVPVGHNVGFDISFIKTQLISEAGWKQFVSYRVLDTCTISQFLIMTGKLPPTVTPSLGSLIRHFNINLPGVAHDAETDTLNTIAVLKAMKDL